MNDCDLKAPSPSFEEFLRVVKARVVNDMFDDSTDDRSAESSPMSASGAESSPLFASEPEQSDDVVMDDEHGSVQNPCVGTGPLWVHLQLLYD